MVFASIKALFGHRVFTSIFIFALVHFVAAIALAFSSCSDAAPTAQSGALVGGSPAQSISPEELTAQFAELLSPGEGQVSQPEEAGTPVVVLESEAGISIKVYEKENAIPASYLKTEIAETHGGGLVVSVIAENAPPSYSALFEISFDVTKYNPSEWRAGAMFAGDTSGNAHTIDSSASTFIENNTLFAAIPAKNTLGVACAIINLVPDRSVSASGAIAEIAFAEGAQTIKAASSIPPINPPRTPQNFWDWDYGTYLPYGDPANRNTLVFENMRFPGDADMDGSVTIADITPIAASYMKEVHWNSYNLAADDTGITRDFDSEAAATFADLDRNGEVGISDISVMSQWYGTIFMDELRLEPNDGSGSNDYISYGGWSPDNAHFFTFLSPDPTGGFSLFGRKFSNPLFGYEGVLPFAYQNSDLFDWGKYYNDVSFDEDAGEFVLDLNIFGDYDQRGLVDISDVTPVALWYPEFLLGDYTHFAPRHFWGDLDYLMEGGNLSLFFPIVINYLMHMHHLEISYFSQASGGSPFKVVNTYVEYDQAAPLSDYFTVRDFEIRFPPFEITEPCYAEVAVFIVGAVSNQPGYQLKYSLDKRVHIFPGWIDAPDEASVPKGEEAMTGGLSPPILSGGASDTIM